MHPFRTGPPESGTRLGSRSADPDLSVYSSSCEVFPLIRRPVSTRTDWKSKLVDSEKDRSCLKAALLEASFYRPPAAVADSGWL